MTTRDPVLAALAAANPVPRTAAPGPLERAQADRILRRVVSTPPRSRHRSAVLVPVLSTVVVLAVLAVVLRSGGAGHRVTLSPDAIKLTLQARPTPQTPVISPAAVSRELHILRARLAAVPGHFHVAQTGVDRIVVTSPDVRSRDRARIVQLVTQRAELLLYDWEANALTPNGHTVAGQLAAQNMTAVEISQAGSSAPGQGRSGSMPLYSAVALAAKEPQVPTPRHLSRLGAQYYLFGTPGSAGCAAEARAQQTVPIHGDHCLLAGPDDELPSTTRRQAIDNLAAQLPPGADRADGQVLVVPQGTVVVQAPGQPASDQPFDSPSARFYVLRDHVALSGVDITDPRAGTDQSGLPDVTFGFTRAGQNAFQRVTAQIAHRGQEVSQGGEQLFQHFAVALDNRLVTIPSIDYVQYPDGIIGGGGADITGGFTTQSARDLATELRLGALPLQLRLVR